MTARALYRTTETGAAAPAGEIAPARAARLRIGPATLLVVLSALFGAACILLNPPMRGPDEPAHFARAYAYAQGIVLPQTEVGGRKGLFIPADIHDDYAFFASRRGDIWKDGFSYRSVVAEYGARPAPQPGRAPVFIPFEGTEGYSPVAYAPHAVAGALARAMGLDFLQTITLMRAFGLAAFTAVAAVAVAAAPRLQWAFFLIAMLPAAVYGRSVVGADGATNSLALLVTALALRAASGLNGAGAGRRALWTTLAVLAKPPQLIFILLEPMVHRFRDLPRRWKAVALVVLPGLVLSPLWIWAVDAEMAAWRLYASGKYPREHFEVGWKLAFMADNPLHFPRVMLASLTGELAGLSRQAVGVLGWLDTRLHWLAYPVIGALLAVAAVDRLGLDGAARARIAAWSLAIVVGYTVGVYLILFITWTPPGEPAVWGVQGRYFVAVMPPAALAVAALVNRRMPFAGMAAVTGALVSGAATVEALWRVNWTP